MQFTKGDFIQLRAVTKIHLGAIGKDIFEDDIIEFDGQTLKYGGEEHQLSNLRGAIKAGWFVVSTNTTAKYKPQAAGVRIKTSLTQENETAEKKPMEVQTISNEERVVSEFTPSDKKSKEPVEPQEATPVGKIKTQAKTRTNLADSSAVNKELKRLEKPVPRADIKKIATGDVETAISGEKLEELLPNAEVIKPNLDTTPEWDMKVHWRSRVKKAVALHTTDTDKFNKIFEMETKAVQKHITNALK